MGSQHRLRPSSLPIVSNFFYRLTISPISFDIRLNTIQIRYIQKESSLFPSIKQDVEQHLETNTGGPEFVQAGALGNAHPFSKCHRDLNH